MLKNSEGGAWPPGHALVPAQEASCGWKLRQGGDALPTSGAKRSKATAAPAPTPLYYFSHKSARGFFFVGYLRDSPLNILYLRPDTIGDLVIFSAAIDTLLQAWPEASHTLLVRRGYESLAPLLPEKLKWRVTDVNPFTQKPSECRPALATLQAQVSALAPDLIVAATINRTWLELAVGAAHAQARRVALGNREVDPLFAAAARLELGIVEGESFPEIVELADGARDWENNHRLVEHLLGQAAERKFPILRVSDAARKAADEVARANDLPAGKWLAVFPAGLANVPIKAWPAEKFAEFVVITQRHHPMPVMLLGHRHESALGERVADLVAAAGGERPKIWLGREGELELLAALLGHAAGYVGHDTGAMHIAAACGRPTLGIFGGGHWPRFRPVGRQVVSIIQPLPCFGCNWDCHFGDAPCVKKIAVADVQAGFAQLWEAREKSLAVDAVVEAQNFSAESLALIAAEAPRYLALQRDRIDRQHRIEELKRETDSKDDEIDALKGAANEKDSEIASLKGETNAKDGEIAGLKATTDKMELEIAELKQAATDRKTEMEAIKAELEAECRGKDGEIAALKSETNGKDVEIGSLKKISNEREQLIFTLDGHVKEFQRIVGVLNGEISAQRENLQRAEAQLREHAARHDADLAVQRALEQKFAAAEAERARLAEDFAKVPASLDFVGALHAKEVHIQNLDSFIAARDAHISRLQESVNEAQRSLANYTAGMGGLEQAKHFGRLLGEKEAVIQTLHRACLEREAIIKQLAAQVTTPTAKAHKVWIAASAHVREKFWRPLESWLFRKAVEQYWMQIGILRHYAPRPLRFDKMPRQVLAEAELPQIGMVTPSYNQAAFVESTILSVLNQKYPKLLYALQDGGSRDQSPAIIEKYASRLHAWESVTDAGQADAVRRGFAKIEGKLQPTDIMAWLNSDDLIAPRVLRFVAEYFARNPEADVIYGHRIIIDGHDAEVGRWVMPRHDPAALQWIDYVPQETLFWRKRAWDLAGGIDPSFQFALDWDLLARFTQAGCKIRRLPYFLGCFRVHHDQKTHQAIHTTGAEEMRKIRTRFHGEQQDNFQTINEHARRARFRGALNARLLAVGIRW